MTRRMVMIVAVFGLLVAGCSSDDDGDDVSTGVEADSGSDNGAGSGTGDASDDGTGTDDGEESDGAAGASGDPGTFALGDEALTVDAVLCYLEEQDRAGLGGTIEFSILVEGTNAAGESVRVDITRERPDPDDNVFGDEPADHVRVQIGSPTDPSQDLSGEGEIGTVTVEDNTVVGSMTVSDTLETGEQVSLDTSFDLNCTQVGL